MTSRHRCAAGFIAIILAAALGAACSREAAKPETPAPAAAPAPPPVPNVRVFVTNESSGDLTIIDADRQTAMGTAPLGKRPRGVKVSPDRRFLYVALSGSPIAGPGVERESLPPPDRAADGIGEFDIASGKITRVIHAGADPEQLDISADGSKMWVANEDTAEVSIVDVPAGKVVASVKIGEEPEGVTLRPDGKVVYVTSEGDGAVFAIDTQTNKLLKRIPVGPRPRSIGFLPDGSRGYVSLENEGAIAVFDAQQQKFLKLIRLEGKGNTPKPRPMGITVAQDGSVVYVTAGSFGHLFFIDPTKNAPTGSIEVGQRPWGIALLPDGKTAYTANGPSNDVSVIDIASRSVIKKIPAGQRPWGVAVVSR